MNRRSFALTGFAALATVQTAEAQGTPTARQNRATIERYVNELLIAGDYSKAPNIIAADYQSSRETDAPGIDAYIERGNENRKRNEQQFDGGYTFAVEDMLADADSGSVRLSLTVGRSGKQVTVPAMYWFVFNAEGKIATLWGLSDNDAISRALYG